MLPCVPRPPRFSTAGPQLPCLAPCRLAWSDAMRITRCPTRSGFPSAWDWVSAESLLQDEIFGELISRGALRGEVESKPVPLSLTHLSASQEAKGEQRKTSKWHLEPTGTSVHAAARSRHGVALLSPSVQAGSSLRGPEKSGTVIITLWAGGGSPSKPAVLFFFLALS